MSTPAVVLFQRQRGFLVRAQGRAYALYQVPSSGGSSGAVWGAITGTLSAQADLQAALDGKSGTGHSHSSATSGAAGFMSAADKNKLDGVAVGATANAADSALRDRATHTGTQPLSSLEQGGATTGQAVVWNGTVYAPGSVSATPGGVTTQVQFNNAGAFAGMAALTYDVTTHQLNYAPTWNNAGTTYIGLNVNASSTTAASNSYVFRVGIGGTYWGCVHRDGRSTWAVAEFDDSYISIFADRNAGISRQIGNRTILVNTNAVVWAMREHAVWGFTPRTYGEDVGMSIDTGLRRDAAGVLAMRDGTNAQAHRWYRTWIDAANYERVAIRWDSTVARLTTEAAGTGVKRLLATDITTMTADPTTSDLPSGTCAVVHNSTSGITKLFANVAGTIKSVALT